jgi:hypothetical protein
MRSSGRTGDFERSEAKRRQALCGANISILWARTIDNAGAIFTAARRPKNFISLDRADHLLTNVADAQYAADMIATWASRHVRSGTPRGAERRDE